jgi:nucleoid-associated protein YgaU
MFCWLRVGELTMSIFKGSRYEYSTIDYVATTAGLVEEPIVLYTASDLGLTSYWEHTYTQGERLDSLSYKYYKNPQYWWLIAEYNPEINDFINITPGTILRVPNV